MAKLCARGRREWIRAERKIREFNPEQVIVVRRTWMSDGKILENTKRADGSWTGWRCAGTFPRHRPLPELREGIRNDGWAIVNGALA